MLRSSAAPFARLRRDLLRRRWLALEPRLRIALVGIALGLAALAFWQLRLRLADARIVHGPRAAGLLHVLILGGIVVTGAAGTSWRLWRRLDRRPCGPSWLALPVTPALLLDHQRWEAEAPMRALAIGAVAETLAAVRIVPWLVWVVAAIAFVPAWRLAVAVGATLVTWRVPRGHDPRATLAERWSVGRRRGGAHHGHAGRFGRGPQIAALMLKDARVAARAGAARVALAGALLLSVASVVVWRLPPPLQALEAYAFALALVAAAAWGEWLVRLGGADPFGVLRVQPVGIRALWASRAAWAALVTIALVVAHALASHGPAAQLHASLFWLALATFSIQLLAVHLQLTLFPRADQALRLFGLALALTLVCSIMIFLMGWIVLFAAVVHSARKLPGWFRIEERA